MGFDVQRKRLAVWLLAWLIGHPALAIVLRPGYPHEPTRPPPDDPGFAHVGTVGQLSGVYIGRGWVLTAAHVVANAQPRFVLGGVAYDSVERSSLQLVTRPNVHADLALFRLVDPPSLPALRIAAEKPVQDEVVTLVGNGWSPRPGEIHWDADWQQVSPARAIYSGLVKQGPGVLRWGRNAITWTDRPVEIGDHSTHSFQVRFDPTGGPAEECTVSTGDSGGAAFAKRQGSWELVGILFARNLLEGQPGNAVVFGNVTEIADLSFYRDQIEDITDAGAGLRLWGLAGLVGVVALLAAALVWISRRRRASRAGPRG